MQPCSNLQQPCSNNHMSALMVELQSRVLCVLDADVAFEMSMNDNLLTGTVPAELQYLPLRVSSTSFSSP